MIIATNYRPMDGSIDRQEKAVARLGTDCKNKLSNHRAASPP